MSHLVTIIIAILRALVPALINASKPTAEDARPQPELRKRLRAKLRRAGWPASLLPVAMLLGLSCLAAGGAGCQPRTIYVPPGEPVRLRETIQDAKVWVLDASGTPVPGKMDLPSGWYCLPDERPAPRP
jgi:hypothetical protein